MKTSTRTRRHWSAPSVRTNTVTPPPTTVINMPPDKSFRHAAIGAFIGGLFVLGAGWITSQGSLMVAQGNNAIDEKKIALDREKFELDIRKFKQDEQKLILERDQFEYTKTRDSQTDAAEKEKDLAVSASAKAKLEWDQQQLKVNSELQQKGNLTQVWAACLNATAISTQPVSNSNTFGGGASKGEDTIRCMSKFTNFDPVTLTMQPPSPKKK